MGLEINPTYQRPTYIHLIKFIFDWTGILPIEVKAGTKGSMQSLKIFMDLKNTEKGIRVSHENFSTYQNIEVYPLYAVVNLQRNE